MSRDIYIVITNAVPW